MDSQPALWDQFHLKTENMPVQIVFQFTDTLAITKQQITRYPTTVHYTLTITKTKYLGSVPVHPVEPSALKSL